MAAWNLGLRRDLESGGLRGRQLSLKLRGTYVSAWLGKQETRVWFADLRGFGEEPQGVGELVYDCEGKSEIDFVREIIQRHGVRRDDARVNALQHVRPGSATFQSGNHLGLEINCIHPARRTNQTSQRNRKKSHARTGFERGDSFMHVRAKNTDRIL